MSNTEEKKPSLNVAVKVLGKERYTVKFQSQDFFTQFKKMTVVEMLQALEAMNKTVSLITRMGVKLEGE